MRGARGPFDPNEVSPNRLNSFLQCGEAFRREYIEREPKVRNGSAALFGTVLHKALETWALDRANLALEPLVKKAWLTETQGTVVSTFIGAYQALLPAVMKAEAEAKAEFEARNGRPTKAVRMTGAWKKHPVAAQLAQFMAEWTEPLRDSPWEFSENDPLPSLYAESIAIAKRYEARNKHLPNAWHSEFGFTVDWHGFRLHGYIDSIEPVVNRHTGEMVAVGVMDYKTYSRVPVPGKDWRQKVFYAVAYDLLRERGVEIVPEGVADGLPLLVGMDYLRWDESWAEEGVEKARTWTHVSDKDAERLLNELRMYRKALDAEVFLPADKSKNPDYCDFGPTCCMRRGSKVVNVPE